MKPKLSGKITAQFGAMYCSERILVIHETMAKMKIFMVEI